MYEFDIVDNRMAERQASIRELFASIENRHSFVSEELEKYELSLPKMLWLRLTNRLLSLNALKILSKRSQAELDTVKVLQVAQKKDLELMESIIA